MAVIIYAATCTCTHVHIIIYHGPPSFISGVGLAVAQRLLSEHRDIRVCLACRNLRKADTARQSLLEEHPGAKVDVLQVDTSSPHSAIAAASEIQKRWGWSVCTSVAAIMVWISLVPKLFAGQA